MFAEPLFFRTVRSPPYGPEQIIRMAGILLDIADGTRRDFDELILEKRGSTYWIHFAVRPKDNRRKILIDCV